MVRPAGSSYDQRVVQHPNFKKLKYYGAETLDGPFRRAWNGPSYLFIQGNEVRSKRICEVWDGEGNDGPS